MRFSLSSAHDHRVAATIRKGSSHVVLLAFTNIQSVALQAARYDEKLRYSPPLYFAQPFTVARAMKPGHTLAAVAKIAQKKPTG
jgi:hypothetical protein